MSWFVMTEPVLLGRLLVGLFALKVLQLKFKHFYEAVMRFIEISTRSNKLVCRLLAFGRIASFTIYISTHSAKSRALSMPPLATYVTRPSTWELQNCDANAYVSRFPIHPGFSADLSPTSYSNCIVNMVRVSGHGSLIRGLNVNEATTNRPRGSGSPQ